MIDDTNEQQQAPESAPAGEETDFGSAFKERLAQGEDSSEARPEPQKPEAQAEGEGSPPAAPEVAKPAEGTSAPAPKPDPWDGLTPEQRSRVEKLQASERSQRGRVGALTKKLNATAAQPAPVTIGATGDQSGQPPPQGGEGERAKPETAESLQAKLEAARGAAKDYPESVGPLFDLIDEVRGQIEGLKAPVAKAQEDADAAEIAKSYEALEEAHGDYADLAADDGFLAWAGDQSDQVKALLNSWNPRDVSLVLTLYKTEQAAAQPTTTTPAPPEPVARVTTETDARRARQLEGSRDTPSRGAPAAAGVPDDFGAAFRARMAKYAEEDARA